MNRNRITYGIAITAAFVMVYFENGKMSFTFLYAVLLMPIISILLCGLSLYGLSITQTIDKNLIIKGEQTKFHILAVNNGFYMTPALSFKFIKTHYSIKSDAKDISMALPARSKNDITFDLSCRYRGVYFVGLQSVQALDFLGLFTLNRNWKDKTQLVVYPRVIEIEHFPLSMNLLSKSYSRYEVRDEDYSAISDVRPYLPSDSMKRIHWKLSAKRNSFMIKNYENTALNSVVIFWDRTFIKGDEEYTVIAEDKIVEIVVAISYYCLKKKIPVDLFYGADEPLATANLNEFEKIYACSAHSEFIQGENIENPLSTFLNAQTNQINITVITSRLTEILLDELAGAYYFGHHVDLLYIPPQHESDSAAAVFNLMKDIGMYAFRININDNILDYF